MPLLRGQSSFRAGDLERHICAITWREGGQRIPKIRTGMFLGDANNLCICTAAHCIELPSGDPALDMERAMSPLFVSPWPKQGATPVMVPVEGELWNWRFHGPEIGMDEMHCDIHSIKLEAPQRDALITGGAMGLRATDCVIGPEHCDQYFVLGFPKEAQHVTLDATGSPLISMRSVKVNLFPDGGEHTRPFRARYQPPTYRHPDGSRLMLSDLDGLSGGPIFGARQTHEGLRYGLCAMQTHCDRTRGEVMGNVMWDFVQATCREPPPST